MIAYFNLTKYNRLVSISYKSPLLRGYFKTLFMFSIVCNIR